MDEDYPLLVVEGLDKSGKTSAIESFYNNTAVDFYPTAEPTETLLGSAAKAATDPTVSALTMMADRYKHNTEIATQLSHQPVICDRYVGSTVAYQGPYLRDEDWFWDVVEETSLEADHTIYIDITAATSKERGAKEYIDDLKNAREMYHEYYRIMDGGSHSSERTVHVVDGEQSEEMVVDGVRSTILQCLRDHQRKQNL